MDVTLSIKLDFKVINSLNSVITFHTPELSILIGAKDEWKQTQKTIMY